MSKVFTYNIPAIMEQTRKIASDYRNSTGQTLPVTIELARFDALRLLNLSECSNAIEGVDAVEHADDKGNAYQIKGRVFFGKGKGRSMVGRLAWQGDWTHVLLVLYNPEYEPFEILQASRESLLEATKDDKPNKRGAMTVAKFRAISQSIWYDNEIIQRRQQSLKQPQANDL
jgi:hypothetical protein